MLDTWLAARLQAVKENGLWRQSRVISHDAGPMVRVDGQRALNLAGNDYLGLAADAPAVSGAGAGASPLVAGHSQQHQALAERLADWLGYPAVRLFSSGFAANVGVLSLFPEVAVFHDRLNHASLLDGSRHAGQRFRRFPHNDLEVLRRWLKGPALLVSDGVFSMDGDCADLPALAALGQPLYVDDAHGIGVLGQHGRGISEAQGLRPDILVGTFGKALGAAGAFVACSDTVASAIDNLCREYIYSTALPLSTVILVNAQLERLQQQSWRRQHLSELIALFQQQCQQRDLPVLPSQTPIQPVLCRSSAAAVKLSQQLLARGYFCPAIRPPTVAQPRLRITLNALIEPAQLTGLCDLLEAHRDCLA